MLGYFDTSNIDVPLVVGRPQQSLISRNAEDNMELCLKKGYEYIDLSQVDEDDAGGKLPRAVHSKRSLTCIHAGQTGLARLSEALQAHMWPNSQMAPRIPRSAALVSEDEEDHIPEPSQASKPAYLSEAAKPTTLPVQQGSQSGFEDDFTPFISSSSAETDLDDPDIPDEDDESDPTAHLTSMFASLVGMREQALAMPNDSRRKDFAAEAAMRFARQLDAMLGEESDDVPDVVPEKPEKMGKHA